MLISWKEAKQALAKYAGKAGKCVNDEDVGLFVKEVVQELLNRGANGSLRRWEFKSQNGTFTAPPDLLLPLKIKIDDCNGSLQGNVYDKFYEFYDSSTLSDCQPFERGAVQDLNTYFTQYDIPGSKRILARCQCKEDLDAHMQILGLDDCGKEIFMPHKGLKDKGEYLSLNKNEPKYTAQSFSKITGIEKSVTKGYITLYWYNPTTGQQGLLAQFRPTDTRPSFTRYRLLLGDCKRCYKVTILGRVQFLDNYSDNDIIPITNLRALKLMAQSIQSQDNDDIQVAAAKEQFTANTINNENQNNRTPQAPVDFFYETSGASMKPLI